jgi:hypothetical protein
MEIVKLDWENFKIQMDELKSNAEVLDKSNPRNEEEFENFFNEYKSWRNSVIDYLTQAFNVSNYYVISFRTSHSNNFSFSGQQKGLDQRIRDNKQALKSDIRLVEYIVKLVSVSDLLIKEVDLEVRKKYDSEEILELLLEKLYDLYDDNIYPVLPILEGNGIQLKKMREEYDYVKILENQNLVFSNNISQRADAQLTIEGKLFVEERRKKVSPNYSLISDDQNEISNKIDQIIKDIEKLGFGQQIIFDEFEELKDLYLHLDKKNWAQLLKGKLVDLGLSQAISYEVMKAIYESFTHEVLRIS